MLAEIMEGNASEVQTAAVLIALRTKGETVDEIVGLATTMRRFAKPVHASRDDLIDTAGTGGGRPTFNVSTTAALIAAGAGCAVAKHGNRSATGLSGSADLLEALGVRIDLEPDAVARCIREAGFGFMFAPAHHGATRYVVPVRKELAVRTIFNFLGPLTNPAGAARQVIGVSDAAFLDTIAGALARLGAAKALVVSSADGLDEMSTSGTTRVVEVDGPRSALLRGVPGGRRAARAPLRGPGRRHARRTTPTTTRRIFAGEPGPRARPGASSTRARRSTSPAGSTRSRRACAPPRRRSTTAPRRRERSDAAGRPDRRSCRARRRGLRERARADRRGHARRGRAPARARAARRGWRRRSPSAPRAGRSPRRCCAPASR